MMSVKKNVAAPILGVSIVIHLPSKAHPEYEKYLSAAS